MPKVETNAYCKVALHAVKFPHCAVRGFLLGRGDGADAVVIDAIPVLHGILLAPPVEIALISADTYCEEKKLRIIGCYFANQLINDESIDMAWAKPLHDKLVANDVHTPIVFRIDNNKLSLNSAHSCLIGYTYQEGKWKNLPTELVHQEGALSTYSAALQSKLHRELADFETHLEEPASDFFNIDLGKKLTVLNS